MAETTDVVGVEQSNTSQWFANASSFQLHQPTFNYNASTSQPGSVPVPGPNAAPSPSSSNQLTRTKFPTESELYSQLLWLRKRGYPFWTPEPTQPIPEEYTRQGIRIGDVGILTTSGGFDYLFNTCLPRDDPANSAGVPEGFEPLIVDQGHIQQERRRFPPGSYVYVSNSWPDVQMTRLRSQANIPGVPDEFGAGVTFSPRAGTGALLILPEGASSTDHKSLDEFRDYGIIWARKWFQFANSSPYSRGTKNLYLVTGCDKTRAWGVSSFFNGPVGSVTMSFVPTAGELPGYRFENRHCAEVQSGSDELGNQSSCVFVRGFKIAIRQQPFIPKKRTVKVTHSSELNMDVNDFFSRQNNVRDPSSWDRMLGHLGRGTSSEILDRDADRNSPPFRAQVCHPSDDVNNWILHEHPQADIAITHDEDLLAVMNEDETEVPTTIEFVRRLSNYLTFSENGDICSAYFNIPRSPVKEIALQVSMESWKEVQDRHVISNLNDMSVDTRHSPYQNKAATLALNNLEIGRATLHREHLFLVFCENVCTLVYTVLKISDEISHGKSDPRLESDWETLCLILQEIFSFTSRFCARNAVFRFLTASRTANNSKKYLNRLKDTLELIIIHLNEDVPDTASGSKSFHEGGDIQQAPTRIFRFQYGSSRKIIRA
ncbi:hypothetical protein DFJ43DRAFT_1054037 [Lentinula guzmanii]|uniref:Uncharacterized protein n=1 Tax=Lentinula guzmanii TaxID=2804957 RepID=A0AA38JVB3_9AGAR|nr:hypothetical protein DFJ43DRAFT_1054037 [Lentinula guzmanii]